MPINNIIVLSPILYDWLLRASQVENRFMPANISLDVHVKAMRGSLYVYGWIWSSRTVDEICMHGGAVGLNWVKTFLMQVEV